LKGKRNTSRPLRVVFFCVLLIVASLLSYNFWEWYSVEKLNHTEGYNFGDTTNRAYYFQSKALYAFIHLFWGICFSVSAGVLLISFVFKARWYRIASIILALLVSGIFTVHWFIA
jgi:hypothetical protein